MQKGSFDRRVAGILLAAGASTRMGKLKQLLPAAGTTLVEKALNGALESDLDRVVLVLGHHARDIEQILGAGRLNPRLTVVHNRDYRQGIGSSLVAGIKEIESSHDHGMVLLADMPFVEKHVINSLITAYLDALLPIGAVRVGDRAAHPIVFRRDLFPELKALTGDTGARSLLEKYAHGICFITPETGYDHRDIDTKEDYLKFQTDLKERKNQWPTR